VPDKNRKLPETKPELSEKEEKSTAMAFTKESNQEVMTFYRQYKKLYAPN